MKLDLSFLLQPPDFSTRAILTVDALAPLSLVAGLPGKYYRSQREPTPQMLYGLIENALGWHVSDKERKELGKKMKNKFGEELAKSGVGFISLLQFHLRFSASVISPLLHYDDLWAQHMKHNDDRHIDGSRNHDNRAIPLLNQRNLAKEKKEPFPFTPQQIVKFFPQYYVSPTPREYVIPQGEYKFVAETNKTLAPMLAGAFDNPAAPLYLGSNDGWIEVRWEILS